MPEHSIRYISAILAFLCPPQKHTHLYTFSSHYAMLICSASALLFFPSSYLLCSLYAHLSSSTSHQKSTHAPIFSAFGSEIDGSLQSGSEYCDDPWLGSSVSHCQTSKKKVRPNYVPCFDSPIIPKAMLAYCTCSYTFVTLYCMHPVF